MNKALDTVLAAIEDKQGKDTLKIPLKNAFTDYFIVTSGGSPPQTQAIADEIERKMAEIGREAQGIEGYREGGWILMDYGDIVVHIFLPENREYYHLEKLWQYQKINKRRDIMSFEVLNTHKAPAAIGPYCQGTKQGGLILTSGQLPINPETGEQQKEIKAATRQSLENVLAVVEAGGGQLTDISKCTVLLKDIADFPAVNEVYADFFGDHKPARSCFQVGALPADAVVEIEAIAYVK